MNKFTIHGTRGTAPIAGDEFVRYGGRTTCFSLETDSGIIVVDAGTGIIGLSAELERNPDPAPITMLFTHFHLDHVIGLPLFNPLYDPRRRVTFVADDNRADDWRKTLNTIASPPFWPVKLPNFGSSMSFESLQSRTREKHSAADKARSGVMELSGAEVSWLPLRHPQQSLAYRIRTPSASFVIVTDHEHGREALDEQLLDFSRNADFLIYDNQYAPEEYLKHAGWGHSTWLEGTRVASEAGARQLVLTHHALLRTDAGIDEMTKAAAEVFPAVQAARDGTVLTR